MLSGTGFGTKQSEKYVDMEERLAREMSKMKIDHDKKKIEVERI